MKLTPVIAQDVRTNNVLMLAYATREALALSRRTGKMHYWSRSRRRLWRKGETSGHEQKVVSLAYDCDRDAILARVEPRGPSCHRGTYSCFGDRVHPTEDVLRRLEAVIAARRRRGPKSSYTRRLLGDPALLRDKLLEEAAELAIASRGRDRESLVGEAADVLYHLLVALGTRGLGLDDVRAELERREGGRRPT